MICQKCNSNPISHKRKGFCTSCYISYRKDQWSLNDKVRTSDPAFCIKRKQYKATYFQINKIKIERKCLSCNNLAIKGSSGHLCLDCATVRRSKNKTQYQLSRKKNHLNTRIRENVKSRLKRAISSNKDRSIVNIIGCSIDELKVHLELKFYANIDAGQIMTWHNYGFKGWHIDHIRPLCSFNLSDIEQFNTAFNYNNLQPLWAKDNWNKGSKMSKMDARCPRKLDDMLDSWCPLSVLRLKAIRNAGRELSEEEEALLPGCPWAVDHQLAHYCFFEYLAKFTADKSVSDIELASLLNVSADTVKKIEKNALSKMREDRSFSDLSEK